MPKVEKITSAKNPRIKNILKLRDRKARGKSGSILVEGIREIGQAREAQVKFREIYFCPDFLKSESSKKLAQDVMKDGVPAFEIPKEIFAKIAFGERQEGLLAVCERPKTTFSDFKTPRNPLFVVVEKIEKPGNLGAILRSCDGAGIDGLILCDGRTDGFNPNVIRSSLGAVFSVIMVEASNEEALAFFKKHQVKIFAALPDAKAVYSKTDFKGPAAIVLGSEQEGLSDFWVKNSDSTVSIPMKGKADSLNVSTTAAILIYEAVRQRSL